jgi:hypothetical protein
MAHGEETALNLGSPAFFLCMMRVLKIEGHWVVRVQRLNIMKIFHEVLSWCLQAYFMLLMSSYVRRYPSLLCLRHLLLVSSPSKGEDGLKSAPPLRGGDEGVGDYEVLLMTSLVILTINRKYHQR